MVDIKKDSDEIRQTIEMMYFAYRGFTGVADNILVEYNMGRAHHRVIYFVGRHPNMTVGELLDILQISKQSLNRVLSTLIDDGFIEQYLDKADRRKRLLGLTKKGIDLEKKLTQVQTKFIENVFKQIDKNQTEGFETTLYNMMKPEEREILKK